MKITLGKLEKSGQDLSEFLGEKLGLELTVEHGEIDIEFQRNAFKNSQVKTYLKRYLYLRGFKGQYRAAADQGSLKILELKNPEEDEEKPKAAEKKKIEEESKQPDISKTEETASKTEETASKTEETASKTEETASKTEETASKT